MTILQKLRERLFGRDDPKRADVVHDIERENVRLNGAMRHLTNEVDAIKAVSKQKHLTHMTLSGLLDDVLRTVNKEKPR